MGGSAITRTVGDSNGPNLQLYRSRYCRGSIHSGILVDFSNVRRLLTFYLELEAYLAAQERRLQRRRHERHSVVLECSWNPGSRVTNLSLGGCFVDSSHVPEIGEEATFIVRIEGLPTTLHGTIVQARRGMGFALEFKHHDELTPARLGRFLSD